MLRSVWSLIGRITGVGEIRAELNRLEQTTRKLVDLVELSGLMIDEFVRQRPDLLDAPVPASWEPVLRRLFPDTEIRTTRRARTAAANAARRLLAEQRRRRARELRSEGLTMRQIAQRLQREGLLDPDAIDPQRSLRRWLREDIS